MSDTKNNNENFEGLGKLLDHNYDNIRELDNPLPGWWLVTFWATIIFSVGYFAYYEFLGGPTLDQELESALAEIKAKSAVTVSGVAADGSSSGDSSAGGGASGAAINFAALAGNAEVMNLGKTHFMQKCLACHGPAGEGTIGPNLTDEYWIHGTGSYEDIHKVVSEGVLDKGMPPWAAQMKPEELQAVVVYAHSLKGTNPPNGKAPQGNKVESP